MNDSPSSAGQRKAVILIAYHFPPDPAVGGNRPARFARYLPQFGYTPYVITASEQPAGVKNVFFCRDTFHTLRGGLTWQAERALRRFVLPGEEGLAWSRNIQRICREIVLREGHSRVAMLSTFPPLGVHLAGLQFAAKSRIPWLADFRDPFANDPGRRMHMTPFQVKVAQRLETRMKDRARFVILNSDAVWKEWTERFPNEKEKFKLIWNGFDPEEDINALPLPNPGVHTMVHVGSLYGGRHPNQILASLDRLVGRGEVDAARVRCKLIGTCDTKKVGLETEVVGRGTQAGWLEFRPPVPKAEAQREAAQAHTLLLLQPQSRSQVPAKLFEYVCIGRPVLAYVPQDSAIERILRQSGITCEFIYSDEPPEATDVKLARFLQLPPDVVRPSASFENDFNGVNQTRTLSQLLDQALGLA